MKNIFLLIISIVCIFNLSAQDLNYIIAGKVSSQDSCYLNNQLLNLPSAYPPRYDSIDMDINNDNLNDIRIISFASFGSGSKQCYGIIKPLDNNTYYCFKNFSFSYMYHYLVKKNLIGDTINASSNWIDSTGYIEGWMFFPPGPGRNWGEWDNQDGYVGLKKVLENDTIYGWLHMQVQNDGRYIHIDSCAFQKKNTQSIKNYNKELTLIYPNPANDKIIIENLQNSKETILSILNISGQELIRQQIKDSKTQVDISNLIGGVYFVKIITDKAFKVRKIIKE